MLYNHSTHTIGSRAWGVRSPSFYGLTAQELESELGCNVSFLEGASGSTHNITGIPVDECVRRMKRAIRLALSEAEPEAVGRLVSLKRPFEFKVRSFDEKVEEEKCVSYVRKRVPTHADAINAVFRDMRKQLSGEQGKTRQTWVQVIALGDVAVVGVPAEYFTIFGGPHQTSLAVQAHDGRGTGERLDRLFAESRGARVWRSSNLDGVS